VGDARADRLTNQILAGGLNLAGPARIMLDHWLELARDGQLPTRRDLDPKQMVPALPHLILLACPPDGAVRVRLAGTQIRALTGMEISGADWLTLVPPEEKDFRRRRIERTLAAAGGYAEERRYRLPEGQTVRATTLVLPLAEEPGGPAQGLLCVTWSVPPPRENPFAPVASLLMQAEEARAVPLDLGFGAPELPSQA